MLDFSFKALNGLETHTPQSYLGINILIASPSMDCFLFQERQVVTFPVVRPDLGNSPKEGLSGTIFVILLG